MVERATEFNDDDIIKSAVYLKRNEPVPQVFTTI